MKEQLKKVTHFLNPALRRPLSLAFVLAMVIGITPLTVSAATYTVTSTDDTSDDNWGDGVCDNGVGLCTLRAAIEESETTVGADVIELPQNLPPVSLLLTGYAGRLVIQHPLTIRGLGPNRKKIQGGIHFNSWLIDTGPTSVTLDNLELTARGDGGTGGAILSFYSDLTLKNCWVHDNTELGALKFVMQELSSNSLSIEDSIISGNSAAGVFLTLQEGGSSRPRASILRSTISGNGGTGLLTEVSGSPLNPLELEVVDSTISGNANSGLVLGAGFSTIRNSLIEGNSTVDIRGGGGIWAGNYLWVINSTIRGNSATRPQGGGGGGGIRTEGSPIAIFGSTIVDNIADVGGGLDLRDINPSTPSQIVNSTVSGNRAKVNGGGLFSQTDLDVQCSTIALNQADSDSNNTGDGGGIYASADEVYLHSSILVGNWSRTGTLFLIAPDCTQSGSGSVATGGYNLISNTRECTVTWLSTDKRNVGEQHGVLPLADNGGPTPTHALATSGFIHALDTGDPQGCMWNDDQNENTPAVPVVGDQRGFSRPEDGGVDRGKLPDKGAFELNGILPDDIFMDGFEASQ